MQATGSSCGGTQPAVPFPHPAVPYAQTKIFFGLPTRHDYVLRLLPSFPSRVLLYVGKVLLAAQTGYTERPVVIKPEHHDVGMAIMNYSPESIAAPRYLAPGF